MEVVLGRELQLSWEKLHLHSLRNEMAMSSHEIVLPFAQEPCPLSELFPKDSCSGPQRLDGREEKGPGESPFCCRPLRISSCQILFITPE
jgi:hypothetical protein